MVKKKYELEWFKTINRIITMTVVTKYRETNEGLITKKQF